MNKQYQVAAMLMFTMGLMGCNSQKKLNVHSHDGSEMHSHDVAISEEKQSNYFGNYSLINENFGTKTVVEVDANTRTMVTNTLPNHKTGTFPNEGNPNAISSQNRTYTFTLNPNYTGKSQWVRQPGVAINGIKFEPGTAEVVQCDTGENYRVEALQDVIDLGLDFNHAHVQPTGTYHYHGTPTSVIEGLDAGEDLIHIGFAHDGFPMYYSKSGKYKPSFKAVDGDRDGEDCTYENPHQSMDISVGGHHDGTFTSDFEYVEGYGDLDECNGISIDGNYMYFVTNEFPYVSRCLMGEVDAQTKRQIGMQGERGPQNGNGPNQRPNATDIIKQMDSNNDGKLSIEEIDGPLKGDFSNIDANNDGFISSEELQKGKPNNNQRPPKHN